MKIRCISNLGRDLPTDCRARGYEEDAVLSLVVGKEYLVYGITIHMGYFWYYICDEDYDGKQVNFPIWNPSPLFEIIDNRLSSHWRCGFYYDGSAARSISIISFKEWAENPSFYYELTEGHESAVSTFKKYKTLMDSEFL